MNPIPRLLDVWAGMKIRLFPGQYEVPGGYRRVYHYHIRKTAGTSLNSSFSALADFDLQTRHRRLVLYRKGLAFVYHKKRLIEEGNYFYASSHIPAHALRLPEKTFTITILRDPLARVLSHYRMLVWARDDPRAHTFEPFWKGLRPEMEWLGTRFTDFLDRTPRKHLLNQLFTFSAGYDVEEAIDRVCSCSAVCFTEDFARNLDRLSARLNLPLKATRERAWAQKVEISPSPAELDRAREMLEPEFSLLARVRDAMRRSEG